MPDGRMLHKKISLNEALADLENDTQRLLFTWGLAHLDIKGRINGSPRQFKAIVAPLLEHVTAKVVEKFFSAAEEKGLIHRYQVGDQIVLEYPKFTELQKLREDREAPSKFPDPLPETPGELPRKSGVTPEEGGSNSGELPSKSPLSLRLRQDKKDISSTHLTPQLLGDLWNQHAPDCLGRVRFPISEKRQKKLRPSLNGQGQEYWVELFQDIDLSDYYTGRDGKWTGMDFDWAVLNHERLRQKLDRLKPPKAAPGPQPPPQEEKPTYSPDPNCPLCRGGGLTKDGPCKCLGIPEEESKDGLQTAPETD